MKRLSSSFWAIKINTEHYEYWQVMGLQLFAQNNFECWNLSVSINLRL